MPFTGAEIKELIMSKSIRINMYHVVVDGLPDSGKSSLCCQLGIADKSQVPSGSGGAGSVPGIDLYEAILSHATLSHPDHQWTSFTDLRGKDGPPVDMLALGLLYFLVGQHQIPNPEAITKVDSLLFDDPIVQQCFIEMCQYLQRLSVQFTTNEALQKILTGPFSLVNVFNIFENKPMREILQTARGQHPNMLLLDLIDIHKYNKATLLKNGNKKFYRSTLHHLVAGIEGASHEKPLCPRCIVVGTHIDEVKSEEEMKRNSREVMKLVETKASDMGVPNGVIHQNMITLDTRNSSQCKQVSNTIVDIVSKYKDMFEVDIPLKFILLRWYLHKLKQQYMTRTELIVHAKKCGVDEKDVDRFLELFRACASIISSEVEGEFLHDHFIMNPVEFLKELYKLYTMKEDGTIPHEYLTSTVNGVVSLRTLKSLWQGQAGEMSVSDFFIKVIDNFGMLTDIGNDEYYIPSLKSDYDESSLHPDSLVITSSRPYFPLRKQTEFIKYFRNSNTLKEKVNFWRTSDSGKNFCNVTYFSCNHEKVSTTLKVRFSFQFIEVSVEEKNPGIYSLLKTALVDIMNTIGKGRYRFSFNIMCPNAKDHFIPFQILGSSIEKCPKCQFQINNKDEKLANRLLWVQSAFQRPPYSVVHPDGKCTKQ